MAKRRREWDMRTFIRLLSEGRGQGTGKDYIPFVMIHDIPSKGICTRVTGTTVGRVHHLLSRNELAFFYILDYDTAVVDIREQFPLLDMDDPLDLVPVIELAESLGIIYPRDPVSRFPYPECVTSPPHRFSETRIMSIFMRGGQRLRNASPIGRSTFAFR